MAESLVIDGLSPAELYVLGTAVGIDKLFALPEPAQLSMLDKQIFARATRDLQRKKLLDDSATLTRQTVLLIDMLEIYAESSAYVRINDQMLAFRKNTSEDLIVLTEQEHWKSYRLEILPKSIFIMMLLKKHPFFKRQPTDVEYKFLLKKLSHEETVAWADMSLDQTDLIAMEWMPRQDSDVLRPYSHVLYVPKDHGLFRTDVISQQTRQASLFYFYKELFDWLDIPYGQEAHAR